MENSEHVKLKEYFERWFAEHMREHSKDSNALEVRMKEHQAAHDREHAIRELTDTRNEQKLDLRLAGMNELRQQLDRQGATFIRIDTVDERFHSLQQRVESEDRNLAVSQATLGKALTDKIEGVEKATNARLSDLETTRARSSGTSGGSGATIDWLFRSLAALSTIVALYLLLSGQ